MFIRDGGMARLAELADSEESAVRVNALWAFRNALFKATSEESRAVLGVLGWTRLQRFAPCLYNLLMLTKISQATGRTN